MIPVLGNILLFISALIATAFVLLYAVSARWWQSEEGRHLMSFNAVISAVLWLSVIRVWVPIPPDTPWFAVLRLVVFGLVPIVLGWRLYLLVKVQILRRDNGV